MAQTETSDYDLFSHEITYIGNEQLIKKLIEPLRSKWPDVTFTKERICEQTIQEIENIEQTNLTVIYMSSRAGLSCTGIFRILIFKNEEYLGFYSSQVLIPTRIKNTDLIWSTEGGDEYKMDLSKEPPAKVKFNKYLRLEFKTQKTTLR